jgi:hypothetical protein
MIMTRSNSFLVRVLLYSPIASLNFLIALTIKLQRESALHSKDKVVSRIRTGLHLLRQGESPTQLYIGNTATFMALFLALSINMYFFHGTETCIIFLSPLLLLLNQDPTLFDGLTHERRYFPLLLGIAVYSSLHM